jgi:hypothetical protein
VTVQITQGAVTSNGVALSVQDLPSVASYGATPGQVSRGFFNYLTLSLARSLNNLQAIQAIPANKTDTSTVRASLVQQITDAIQMRGNIDLIVSGSQPSLSIGTTTSGSPIQFDSNTIDLMDRMIAMHLQAVGYFPNTSFPMGAARVALAATTAADLLVTEQQAVAPTAASSLPTLIADLGKLSGVVGLVSGEVNAFQPIKSDNFLSDNVVSGLSGVASLAGVIGAVAAAPEIVTAAAVAGAVLGTYTIARDLQNIALSPEGITWNSGTKLALDVAGTVTSLFGAQAVGSGLLKDVTSGIENIGANGVSGLVMQAGGFAANTGTLSLGLVGLAGAAGTESAQYSPVQLFGRVDGTAAVTNSLGPILSGLPGVHLTEPNTNTQFYSIADGSGSFEFVVPIGVAGFNYSAMQLQTFDPVAGTLTGSSSVVDLSGISPTATVQIPAPVMGQCIDVGFPDGDDPDCD